MILTYKIVLDKRYQKPDGSYPLKLRVYHGPAYKEKSLSLYLLALEWDEHKQEVTRKNKLFQTYNRTLGELKVRVQKLILEAENSPSPIYPDDIIKKAINAPNSKITFQSYCDTLIASQIRAGKVGNARAYRCAANQLQAYFGNQFYFEQVTPKALDDFKASLLSRGVKPNSVAVYLREIRAIYNKAIVSDVIDSKYYPFIKVKIKGERTINRVLSIDQMKALVHYPLGNETQTMHWRNIFVLSFCLIGINFADLLTLSTNNIVGNRIVFKRKKTGKLYSILLHSEAIKILNLYRPKEGYKEGELLLPIIKQTQDLVKLKKDILQAGKTCNLYLKKLAKHANIDLKVTTYYARYCWANTAKNLGYTKDLIAEALGHEYGNKVTGIYLDHYSNEVIDEANARVINAIFE